MGYRQREIESKLLVVGAHTLASVDKLLYPLLKRKRRLIAGKSLDTYFHPPQRARADFVRLRQANKDGGAKLTIKFSDKGNNFNRIERDVELGDFRNYRVALKVCQDLFGKPAGTILKRYIVYFMGSKGTEEDTTISLYSIIGDSRVFLEVEGKSPSVVFHWTDRIKRKLPYPVKRIKKSLFELFIKRRP